ncbi:CIC11C00000000412 [Sungouiella intermedia]|uniref:CIC11C00000000412 n=1 Tax=Sungouiella intermedia TaxID=45354 RepID=A0A1L0CTM7_9ASCO|nr:CIC11C00000000412 [[Candida] intermedia]
MPKKSRKNQTNDNDEDQIVATSQVSRFHKETLTTLSKDIDLKTVNITAGLKDLIVDSDLRLFEGVKYGVIGPNGCGKTTLLKCIGYKRIPGIASNLRTLYVEQIGIEDENVSVLETVLRSDKARIDLLRQQGILENALESEDSLTIRKAIHSINLIDRQHELRAAQKIAAERSGARGFRARKELVEQEKLMEEMETLRIDDSCVGEDDVEQAQEMLNEITESLAVYESEELLKANAIKILTGLGFSTRMQTEPTSMLSGGWKIRASLASALLIKPNILLLDEPTNHLDLPTVLWLQNYLSLLEGVTLVTVSHNRAFLNAVAEEMIIVKDCHLEYFVGNYDEYVADHAEKQAHLASKAEAVEKKKEAITLSVEKALANAKKSGDDKKVQSMVSKKKKLDRLGMDVNEKGHRFKLNRDRAGYHLDIRDDIVVEKELVPDNWKVEQPYKLRYSGDILVMNNVGFRYDKNVIFGRVNFSVGQRARIAIVGANGTGKSTFCKLLTNEALPSVGTIERPGNPTIGSFEQFNVESFLKKYDESVTPLAIMMEMYPDRKEAQYRNCLGKFGVRGNTAIKPLRMLSGGEMARTKLALNFFELSPHLLILDEPTNHLDMLSIESLAELIDKYEGAVIVASHDQFFVSKIAKEIYTFDKKQLKKLESMESYVSKLGMA